MKDYTAQQIRNIALAAHSGAGKTSLAEMMLFAAKATDRLGNTAQGNTVMDFDPEETKRQISISTGIAALEWKNTKVNILDTPGYFDFEGDVRASLSVSDAAVIVVNATSDIEVGTEKAWAYSEGMPRAIAINKLDRENTDFAAQVEKLRDMFGQNIVPLTIPVGSEDAFKGVVSTVDKKSYMGEGANVKEGEVPADLNDMVSEYFDALVEAVAAADEELMEKYFEEGTLTDEEIKKGLAIAVKNGDLVPLFAVSATKGVGVAKFMDDIVNLMPAASEKEVSATKGGETVTLTSESGDLAVQIFKTTTDAFVGTVNIFRVYSGTFNADSNVYNVSKDTNEKVGQILQIQGKKNTAVKAIVAGDLGGVAKLTATGTGDTLTAVGSDLTVRAIELPEPCMSMCVMPKAKGDEEKIGAGLTRLLEEDPTLKMERNTSTNEMILSGMGDQHLEIICAKLKNKFGVEVELKVPTVPYRETIRKKVTGIQGRHKKQSGGRGQFGDIWMEFEPITDSDERFIFEERVFGGAVPRNFFPAVEKGIREMIDHGVLAGFPVVGLKATLYDGSYHPVDSSEMAFKIAAHLAFKKGIREANPVFLEPIMNVEVIVPESYMGDIMGDLNKKRGRIMGMDAIAGGKQSIKAQVPQAEMFRYAIDLRSMTQGRGFFKMEFDHFEEVPAMISEKIIAEHANDRQDDEE